MGHYITMDSDKWYILYNDELTQVISGFVGIGTRIDSPLVNLELFDTEEEMLIRLEELIGDIDTEEEEEENDNNENDDGE
jgi:hypothetical protein